MIVNYNIKQMPEQQQQQIKYKQKIKQNNSMRIDFISLQTQLNFQKHKLVERFKGALHENKQRISHQSRSNILDTKQHLSLISQTNYSLRQSKEKHNQDEIGQNSHQKIRVAVMYPYQISKSLSPQHYSRQINYLQKQNIIPKSALKYIKKQVQNQITTLVYSQHKAQQKQPQKSNKSESNTYNPSFLQQTKNSKNSNKITNVTRQQLKENSIKMVQNKNTQLNYFSTITNTESNKKGNKSKKYTKVHAVKQEQKQLMLSRKQKYTEPKQKKQKQVYSKQQEQSQPKQVSQEVNIKNTTLFKQTAKSKIMKEVQKKRFINYQSNKTNVYSTLYENSFSIQIKKKVKRQIQNINIEKQKNISINQEKQGYAKKYLKTVKGTFFQRLQKSIQKIGYKQRIYRNLDMTTGRNLFQPETIDSKRSYQHLFKKSIQKIGISSKQKNSIEKSQQNQKYFRKIQESKRQKSKNQKATTRITSKTKTPFQSTKRSVYNQCEKDEKHSHSLNRSLQIFTHMNLKVVQRITKIFYPENLIDFSKHKNLSKKSIKSNSQITIFDSYSHRQIKQKPEQFQRFSYQEDFIKTVQSFSALTEQEYHILEPLFIKIQLLQKSTPISRIMFKTLLTNFIKKLNLYDQIILREPIQIQRKKERIMHSFNREKEYIESSTFKKHLNNASIMPIINIKSMSLQKLAGHAQKLYFL